MALMAHIDNRTPFAAEKFVLPDTQGQEVMLVVLKCSFEAGASGAFEIAQDQSPVISADVYAGEPGVSSVRFEADLALEKPFVDVLVDGSAHAPRGHRVRELDVVVELGDVRKRLLVSGDRHWRRGVLGLTPSAPEPFDVMPLVYERAFGGTLHHEADPARRLCALGNPVGVGYRGAMSAQVSIQTQVPNLEYPDARIESPDDDAPPAALGPVGRGWVPRIGLAGRFDRTWLEEQWPLMPPDFDARHHQASALDQQSATICGGERGRVTNMSTQGEWTFRLPRLRVPLRYYFDDRESTGQLRLDTVLIQPHLRRLTLTARAALRTVRGKGLLREVVLGHMSQGWLRAHTRRKVYVAGPTDGVLAGERLFEL